MNYLERRKKAEKILRDTGLLEYLSKIGEPHVIGSYKMNMMAWNDLDIDVENDRMNSERLYELTGYILDTFHPLWYEAKEEVNDEGKTVWFHGFHAIMDGEIWNFDLWFFDRDTIDKAEDYCNGIMRMAEQNPESRERIMKMKQELLDRDLYSFYQYSSMDVYRAVLEQGISDAEELLQRYIRKENRL